MAQHFVFKPRRLFIVSYFQCLFVCSILCLPPPSSHSLHHIYGTILGRFLEPRDFSSDVKTMRHDIISAAVLIYNRVNAALKPTPSKCHYLFNLRDLSKVSVDGRQRLCGVAVI